MLKIRRSRDRLIFNMGIPIPGKDGLYNEMGAQLYMQLACTVHYQKPLQLLIFGFSIKSVCLYVVFWAMEPFVPEI